jgi:Flp pilus assembly protein TadD
MKSIFFAAAPLAALLAPAPAAAQLVGSDDPAPGYSSILNSNYSAAEREIRAAQASPADPARAINLGIVLAKTGHREEAAAQFQRVLTQDDVQFVVANGSTVSSHEVAQRALAALENGVLAR